MSVSSYSSQVNRLSDEIGKLRTGLAAERKKLADSGAKANKAAIALSKASSASQMSSKAREVERQQKAAAAVEKKIAGIEKTIAAKQKSLDSAQVKLERARRDAQKKDDRESEKRRKVEMDHVKALERRRRSATAFPDTQPRSVRPEEDVGDSEIADRYDVCLSFAGEQRAYVELVARELKLAGLKVFYDQDEEVIPMLWGKNLAEYLDYVYQHGSRFCLMFISKDYAEKVWTIHERRSAIARAMQGDGEYILPARFDDTELPGLHPTVGYLDLTKVAPATLAEHVVAKLTGQ